MSVPTLAWPLRLAPDGSFATIPQDSAADLGQSVEMLLLTRVGDRVDELDYGITDPAFHPVDPGEIAAAAAQWEPRADPAVAVEKATADRPQLIPVSVSLTG